MILKKISAALLCVVLSVGLVGCQGTENTTVTKGTLRVGVRDFVPGFGYQNPDSGVYSGLEIDIAKALAKGTGNTLELVSVDNAQRTQMLDDDEVDCVIATFSETEERKENYDLSVSYYTDHVMVLVENTCKIDSIRDLAGLTVGVVQNTTAAEALVEAMVEAGYIPETDMAGFDVETFSGGLSFTVYDDYDALEYGLETGEVDAVAGDGSLLIGYKTDERTFLPEKLAEQYYCVCMKKDSPLKSVIDELITQMLEDGTIEEYIVNHGLEG